MKILLLLLQFDVVSIIPMWVGKEEISLTNLSLTVIFVVLLGIFILYGSYRNYIVPRVWQGLLESLYTFVYRVMY